MLRNTLNMGTFCHTLGTCPATCMFRNMLRDMSPSVWPAYSIGGEMVESQRHLRNTARNNKFYVSPQPKKGEKKH